MNALNAVHHAGIRIATGAFRSSPIQSLLVDAGVLPLKLIRQSHIIKYWMKAQRLPSSFSYSVIFIENNPLFFENKPLHPKLFSVRVRIILEALKISKGKVLPVRYFAFPPWKLPSVEYCSCLVGFKKDNSDGVVRQHFLNHLESHKSSVYVFTDALSLMLVLDLRLYFLILTTVGLYQLMLLFLHLSFMVF